MNSWKEENLIEEEKLIPYTLEKQLSFVISQKERWCMYGFSESYISVQCDDYLFTYLPLFHIFSHNC